MEDSASSVRGRTPTERYRGLILRQVIKNRRLVVVSRAELWHGDVKRRRIRKRHLLRYLALQGEVLADAR